MPITDDLKKKVAADDVWIPTVCKMCFNACAIKVHRVNGVAVKIEGNPDCPSSNGQICAKGNAGLMSLYSPSRLKVPLKRTNPEKGIGVDPKWVEIGWEEALDTIAKKLNKIRKEDPRKLILMSFDLDFLVSMKVPLSHTWGTPNSWTGGASNNCGNGVHTIAYLTDGTFTFDPDTPNCNYMIQIGVQSGFMADANPMIRARHMAEARERGMKLVVVDPIMNVSAAKADEWLPIRPGTDAAFALGILNVLLNDLGIYDAEFLKKRTNAPYLVGADGHYLRDKATNQPLIWDAAAGKARTHDDPDTKDPALEGSHEIDGAKGKPAFQLLKEHVRKYTPEEVAEITTIPAETIRRIAKEYGEAARIGSKIVIDGVELPYRPAGVHYLKGAIAHQHAILTGLAIQFLNLVVGNINVPGGKLGANTVMLPNDMVSFSWGPVAGPDGMLTPGGKTWFRPGGYPAREVRRPQRIDKDELFPCAIYSEPFGYLCLLEPEKFKLSYAPEMIIIAGSNPMMSTINPKQVEQWLKKLFTVQFIVELDETSELADIVLPNAHYLECLNLFPNVPLEWIESSEGWWYFEARQPVVAPPPGVRYWLEVIFDELIPRTGTTKEFNHLLNIFHGFKEPYRLDLDKSYTYEEFHDIWAKAWFGPEHDLAWFKEHGFIKWPKQTKEKYPGPFIKARIPIYLEHFIAAGEKVKQLTDEMGFDFWDVADYQPCLTGSPATPMS